MDQPIQNAETWFTGALGQLINSPLMLIFAGCLLCVLICMVLLYRFSSFGVRSMTSETGSATLEFALIIPMLLFCTLMLAQTTLLMGGNIFVHYAAFAATRSAITTLPLNYTDTGESRNYLLLPNGAKKEHIRQAAIFALLPVAGRIQDSTTSGTEALVNGFESYYELLDKTPPAWINGFLAERLNYANRHTDISFSRVVTESEDDLNWVSLEEGMYQFGPREPISVQVEHDFYLAVPYVRYFFADSLSEKHTLVKAFYTLNNEGIDTELPPSPRIPLNFTTPLPLNSE